MPSKELDPDVAEELAFYKSQIATLESELADFQASSRELEAELEKELEASEKQHRSLREKNESLRYEVDEWKVSLLFPIPPHPTSPHHSPPFIPECRITYL